MKNNINLVPKGYRRTPRFCGPVAQRLDPAARYWEQAQAAERESRAFCERAIAAGATMILHDELLFPDPRKAEAFQRSEQQRRQKLAGNQRQ